MILTFNIGSTSLKYKLFDQKLREVLNGSFSDIQLNQDIFRQIADELIKNVSGLKIVHRVVHGGAKYHNPIKITAKILNELKKFNSLAPLHNPYNLKGIELAQKYFPTASQYAVFDTGFYQTLPNKAKIYPLPLKFYQKHGIQKYGFHGISHQYALETVKQRLKINQPNVISIHLGGGCSITVIKKGKAVDTSMGWTPMEGLMMWSRPGDVDLGIVLNSNLKFQIPDWNHILNYQAGLKGIAGGKNYLDLLKRYQRGEKRARLALEMFIYRIQKYIGAYWAVLDGQLDALTFTGKIGAGDPITQKLIRKDLKFLKKVKIISILPNEEWLMAKLIHSL